MEGITEVSDRQGWIKLHKKIVDNQFLKRDVNAYVLFTRLLLVANNNGEVTAGRYMLAELTGMKPITAYKTLKRLEKEGLISVFSNNQVTTISICKWTQYQANGNNAVTTREQPGNTYIRTKNKEIRNNSRVSGETLESVYRYYLEKFNTTENRYKLTADRRKKIQARLRDAGEDMVRHAIAYTAESSFYQGDNDRGWKANLDFIIRSYEQVEKLATQEDAATKLDVREAIAQI